MNMNMNDEYGAGCRHGSGDGSVNGEGYAFWSEYRDGRGFGGIPYE